jgi:hypothetical protein
MSGDEIVVTIASLVVGPVLWIVWWARARAATPFAKTEGPGVMIGAVAACGALIFAILKLGASHDVRDAPQYLFMYVVLGVAWIRLFEVTMAFAGLSVRDDVIERRNLAAMPAAIGALLGATLSYAGGNIGDGPGWWVVVFSAALSTATLMAAWLLLERITSISDAVTIDRDPSAGVRLGAFLAACGLVLGRAVAGDWTSAAITIRDYARFLPAVGMLVILGAVVERLARPTPERPRASMAAFGYGAAVLYLGFAAAYAAMIGWPE